MRLLVLGGTVFLGRHVVEAALARGHRVTLFHRGRHNPQLFPDQERLLGDRDGDLSALRGRRWDAVVDTSGATPRAVSASAALLRSQVEHYTFVSTLWVYAGFPAVAGLDEDAPLRATDGPVGPPRGPEDFGVLKAGCEAAVRRAMGGRAFVVRAGLLAGPFDPTGRFTYWPARVAAGGEVLAPGPPEQPLQLLDVRDLARWIVTGAERRLAGTYNATGPDRPLTMRRLLDACRAECGSDAVLTWVDGEFLRETAITAGVEIPLWIPDAPGVSAVSWRRAVAAGLAFRPLAETIRDTHAWDRARPPEQGRRVGPDRAREAELLRAWHGRRPAAGARASAPPST